MLLCFIHLLIFLKLKALSCSCHVGSLPPLHAWGHPYCGAWSCSVQHGDHCKVATGHTTRHTSSSLSSCRLGAWRRQTPSRLHCFRCSGKSEHQESCWSGPWSRCTPPSTLQWSCDLHSTSILLHSSKAQKGIRSKSRRNTCYSRSYKYLLCHYHVQFLCRIQRCQTQYREVVIHVPYQLLQGS